MWVNCDSEIARMSWFHLEGERGEKKTDTVKCPYLSLLILSLS